MPNAIRVTSDTTEYPSLKILQSLTDNNIYVGKSDYPYGPSDVSNYYVGVTPPNLGYIVYYPTGENTFLIYSSNSSLDNLAVILYELFTVYWGALGMTPSNYDPQTMFIAFRSYIFNRDYEDIIIDDLSLCIDFGSLICRIRIATVL